jgi:hypothetical protein
MVKDHITDEAVPNVDRIPIEEHLVMARKFVHEWMNRRSPPKEQAVIRILARIDLHIRRRWWRIYADNPTWTFSRAITATESLADNQWSFDYAAILYTGALPWNPGAASWERHDTPFPPGRGGGGGRRARVKGQGKGGKGQGKGQNKGEGKGAKGGGKGGISIGTCSHGNQRVKCAKSKNGKWFCSFFDVQNNCRNAAGTCSEGMRRCNIMVSATKVCNGSHSGKDHTGTSMAAGQR